MTKMKSIKVKSGKKGIKTSKAKPIISGKKAKEIIAESRLAFAAYLKEHGDNALLGVAHELYVYIYYAADGVTVLKKLSDYISENRELFLRGGVADGALLCIGTATDAMNAAKARIALSN